MKDIEAKMMREFDEAAYGKVVKERDAARAEAEKWRECAETMRNIVAKDAAGHRVECTCIPCQFAEAFKNVWPLSPTLSSPPSPVVIDKSQCSSDSRINEHHQLFSVRLPDEKAALGEGTEILRVEVLLRTHLQANKEKEM